MSEPRTCDCLMVGGGPSGATLAGLLASWGRDVVLVHDGRDRHGIPAETMLPAAAQVLERCGLQAVIAEHDFFGLPRHGVRWESDSLTYSPRDDAARGFRVDRSVFDRALRQWARDRGARVLDAHRVVDRLPAGGAGTVQVQAVDGSAQAVRARAMVVATGRNHSRLVDSELEASGRETVAVSVVGEGDRACMDASVIEAVPEGWLWWLPLRSGQACVSTFVDAEEYRARGRALLDQARAHSAGPAASLQDSSLRYAAKGTPRLLRSDQLLVGDAASVVDPLSSQGLEKALSSAEHAACAVNTILADESLRQRVIEHHGSWERGLWQAHARQTAELYARSRCDAPFWTARRTAVGGESEPVELPARFCVHPQLEPRQGLARRGRLLVEEPGYGLAGSPETISRLGSVPLAPLIDLLAEGSDLPTVLRGAARSPVLYPLSPAAVRRALEELFRRGLIKPPADAR